MPEKIIVAVDFDGTLCDNNYPKAGAEHWGLIHALQELKIEGKIDLILWTCRSGEDLEFAVNWCKERGLIFDTVNENLPRVIEMYHGDTRKVSADIYIDDFGYPWLCKTDAIWSIKNEIETTEPHHVEKEKS